MAISAVNTGRSGAASMRPARLHDRFDILPAAALTDLNTPAARAYAVEDQRSVGASYFALIADPRQPVRMGVLSQISLMKTPNLLIPVDHGIVDWAPAGRHCLAIIYERPAGGLLLPNNETKFVPWSDSEVIDRVIVPLVPGIRALSIENASHRAIRPSNIFFRDASRRHAVLGDCVTGPPGAFQPMAYEPIESGLTMPTGRGSGGVADDLYALGVLVLHLLLGHMPGFGLPDAAMLDEKIRRGSYQTLAGETRFPIAITELIRGLLIDDPDERWTITEIDFWSQGRRMSPKMPSLGLRAARPFEVDGEQCFTLRSLGRALVRSGEKSAAIVRGPGFDSFLQRAIGDKQAVEAVAQAMSDGYDSGAISGAGADARLVARVAIALDPPAPIRFRDAAVAINGIGMALTAAVLGGGEVRVFAEIIQARLPQFWCARQRNSTAELNVLTLAYDRLRRVLDDPRPGYGIERALYELNPGLHCLSPFVEDRHVETLADLLPALESAVEAKRIEAHPIDRHIAAFAAQRARQAEDPIIAPLADPSSANRILGMLQMLATIQAERGPAALPALTQFFGRQAPLVLERFRNRQTRERMQNQLNSVLRDAHLPRLLQFLDNKDEQRADAANFLRAQAQFRQGNRQLDKCEDDRMRLPQDADEMAAVLAAAGSALLGALIVVLAFLAAGKF